MLYLSKEVEATTVGGIASLADAKAVSGNASLTEISIQLRQ
jgi:hypothetical protein